MGNKLIALARAKGLVLPLAWLAAGGAALALFYCFRHDRACMDWWLQRVSMPCKQVLGAAADLVPFSVAEALCTAAGVGVLAVAVHTLFCLATHRPVAAAARLCWLAALVLWVYCLVCALWGTQYYGTSFQEKIGLAARPISKEELLQTTVYFRDKVNETALQVERDANGLFAVGVEEIFERAEGIYETIVQEYPCLEGPERKPKKALYSWFMSKSGFTGYLFPLAGESNLNVHCPPVLIPATIAHEFSHQRGVAPEQEANFCAVRAATTSKDPVYEYSGWLFGYIYLYNALYGVDRELAFSVAAGLCPEAMTDLNDNSAYWKRFEGPVKQVAQSNYEGFIRGYGQELGMASYGACVDLLAAWYLQR